ncbi:MAG: LysR family transcriptional regulator, partial [Halieaceae bacterium]
MKNLNQIDLNLLVYLEVLLRERNVTQAANQLGLSQPAMSNGLRRLRALFDDPLLVRTSEGMTPTERALELEPLVKEILLGVDRAMQPATDFAPADAQMVVRIMASDYAESTLFPAVLNQLREQAPGITLDIMNPSDVSFLDVERGKVDL